MRKILIYILVSLCTLNSKAQSTFDVKESDVVVFEFKVDNVKSMSAIKYSKKKLIVFSILWGKIDMGSGNIEKKISFIKNKDTMYVRYSNQENNLYFKNMLFKKGNYELNFNPNNYLIRKKIFSNIIKGSKIKTSNQLQDTFFKNTFIESTGNPMTTFQNIYFKDLKFIEIDVKDTVNIKLKKLD